MLLYNFESIRSTQPAALCPEILPLPRQRWQSRCAANSDRIALRRLLRTLSFRRLASLLGGTEHPSGFLAGDNISKHSTPTTHMICRGLAKPAHKQTLVQNNVASIRVTMHDRILHHVVELPTMTSPFPASLAPNRHYASRFLLTDCCAQGNYG